MQPRYTPFEKPLAEILPDELATLRRVSEGWYVEYKSKITSNRVLAKSLSAFANQHGGWLILGVVDDREENVAKEFPGIENSEVPSYLENLRNSSKDLLRPPVYYDSRVFEGPIDSISLPSDRSVIVIRIPAGPDTPYVHNDGRIYRRVGDSSDPEPVIDQTTINLLAQRGEEARSRLSERVLQKPAVSQGEENQPFVHLTITSDPYEFMGHRYRGGFSEFSVIMKEGMLPFDNIFPAADGYVARQTMNNDKYSRVLTWEFSRHCHSFITIPIQVMPHDAFAPAWRTYETSREFVEVTGNSDLKFARILDLNQVFVLLIGALIKHRQLAKHANVTGPYYVKAVLQNVWRTIPFIDIDAFIGHLEEFGIPLVQYHEVLAPMGTSLDTFVVIEEREPMDNGSLEAEEIRPYISESIGIGWHILAALGIPIAGLEHIDRLFSRYFNSPK